MKIALVFDKLVRPDTTGIYCEKALRSLGHTVLYHAPLAAGSDKTLSFVGYGALDPHCDLYLQIDDDLSYPGPVPFKPNAYWCIDTHRFQQMMGGWSRAEKARGFDRIFTAQKQGVDLFRALGYANVGWLPLGFDPETQARWTDPEKKYDWCFVGHLNAERRHYLQLLAQKWPNGFVGKAFGPDMVQIYNQSRIIFNCSISNDLNMRVFEAMACGGLLITNRTDNGQADLLGPVLITYADDAELLAHFDFFLRHEAERAEAADRQYRAVQQHTYAARMTILLEKVRTTSAPAQPTPPLAPLPARRARAPAGESAYRVCIIQPERYPFSAGFNELALLLYSALKSNGLDCDVTSNELAPERVNILLGYHLLKFDRSLLNYRYIPYQLEQLSREEGVFSENVRRILSHAERVWDYSQANIEFLRRFDIPADYLCVGYHENLEQIPPSVERDIDVLFYGLLMERRMRVLEQLLDMGLNVRTLCGIYGRARDEYIARSKLILNIHFYSTKILEAPRIAYLLNNQRFVLSEASPLNPYLDVDLCLARYDDLVEQCRRYLSDSEQMDRIRRRTYEQFKSQYPMTRLIRAVL